MKWRFWLTTKYVSNQHFQHTSTLIFSLLNFHPYFISLLLGICWKAHRTYIIICVFFSFDVHSGHWPECKLCQCVYSLGKNTIYESVSVLKFVYARSPIVRCTWALLFVCYSCCIFRVVLCTEWTNHVNMYICTFSHIIVAFDYAIIIHCNCGERATKTVCLDIGDVVLFSILYVSSIFYSASIYVDVPFYSHQSCILTIFLYI